MVKWWTTDPLDVRLRSTVCYLVFSGHGALNVKLRTLKYFTLYLRNHQNGNLRAIESCICGIRSIERNMMSFLRTVHPIKNLFYLIVMLFYVKMKSTVELIWMGTIEKKGNYFLFEHLITLLFANIRHIQYFGLKVVV